MAYDGTDYAGFQVQADRPTVQGALEEGLYRIGQQRVRVTGAGRTDAGVHARGQVIGFRLAWKHPVEHVRRAMNAVLPDDIAILEVSRAPERFHARHSAKSRTYSYRVLVSDVRSPLDRRFAYWIPWSPDIGRMAEASRTLLGSHDMAAFGQPTSGSCTTRAVFGCAWRELGEPGLIEFTICASGFLRGMARRIVGTLLQVGRGWRSPDDFAELLASKDIAQCGTKAPAHGLCLERVDY